MTRTAWLHLPVPRHNTLESQRLPLTVRSILHLFPKLKLSDPFCQVYFYRCRDLPTVLLAGPIFIKQTREWVGIWMISPLI